MTHLLLLAHHAIYAQEAIIPLVIPLIMAGASLVKGIADSEKAKKEARNASNLNKNIPQTDPGVQGHLNDIRQQEAYARTGMTRMLGVKRQMIQDAGQQTDQNLAGSSGGNSGGYIDSVLRSQNITQGNLAQAGAQSEGLGNQLLNMETPLISDIADRRLSLQTYGRDVEAAKAARDQADANSNIYGAMSLLGTADYSGRPKMQPDPQPQGVGGYGGGGFRGRGGGGGSWDTGGDWGMNYPSDPTSYRKGL